MGQSHCTITPATVRVTARTTLQQTLPWCRYGRRVTVGRLLDLLLLVAALGSSLSAVARRFGFGFSHETARQAVRANLPTWDLLTAGLVDALWVFGGRALRKRRWDIAIDLHYCPYYGDRRTPGIVGGPKKAGSKSFFAYATAVLLHRHHRYTVGLLGLTGSLKPHEIVAALLAQLDQRGLRLRAVVLDSGFDSGETLRLLQGRRLAYTVPLRRKGRGDNRRNACFALPVGTRTTVSWVTEKTRQKVRTQAVVARRPGQERVHVYAYGGWLPGRAVSALRRAQQAERAYRRRFGIETSYRQMRECLGTTTATGASYRLLLVGLALLLRQVWVWLTQQLARDRGAGPSQWLGECPLQRLRQWLGDDLRRRYPEERSLVLHQPLLLLEDSCKP